MGTDADFRSRSRKNDDVADLLDGSMTAEKLSELFIAICGEQFDEYGQNLIKVLAQNGRLNTLPEVCSGYLLLNESMRKKSKLMLFQQPIFLKNNKQISAANLKNA